MIPLAVVATCAAIGLNTANVASRPATLPACDSYLGVSDLQDFVATSPAGKVSGLKLLSMTDVREVARSATEVACNGTGHLNTGAVRMDYSFYFGDGKRLVEAHW
jgi:hypothetical protein